jgi:hypothetical protein
MAKQFFQGQVRSAINNFETSVAAVLVALSLGTSAEAQTKSIAATRIWADAGVSVYYSGGGTGASDFVQALRTAAQRWNTPSFVFEVSATGQGDAPCGGAPGANIMMVYFFTSVCGSPWAPNQVGTTPLYYSSSGRYITSGDIVLNTTATNCSIYTGALQPNSMDFTRVAVHELGRLAGLVESSDPTSIMFPMPTNVETPSVADLNALTALYAGVPPRPLGGFTCYQNTTPPFQGLGPISGNFSVTGKCLDAIHKSVDYGFSLDAPLTLSITLYPYHTEINFQVMNGQGAVLYSDVDDGNLQKNYTAKFDKGNYTVRLWREVAGSTYDLNFAQQ